MPLLIGLYSVFFLFLAHKNFRLAIGLFIIALPAYLVRFNVGPLPSTLLELNFGIIFLVWLIKYARYDVESIKYKVSSNQMLATCYLLLATSSFAAVFVSDMWFYSLGQWRAYFLEPMLVFVMLVGRMNAKGEQPFTPTTNDLILFLALSTIPISTLAIIQKITGSFYPPALWDDSLGDRVTSFFTSPNAVGLYLAPIVLLAMGVIASEVKRSEAIPWERVLGHPRGLLRRPWGLLAMTLLNMIALLLTKSLGAFMALAGGLLVFFFLLGYKKTTLVALLAGVILALTQPAQNLLAHKSQSSSNRLVLWSYSWSYLADSPKNFIFGAGIRQFFRKIQKPHYVAKELERLIYPHNIFLNFWTEIGLIGLLAFIGIFISLSHIAYRISQRDNRVLGASMLASLAAVLLHGLIDVPYFKNDLAMLWWIIAACVIASEATAKQSNPLAKSTPQSKGLLRRPWDSSQ